MRFKKRFIPFIVMAGLVGISNSRPLSMRQSDRKQTKYIEERTGQKPVFIQYDHKGQNIHYTQMGDDKNEAVTILVHGSPGSSSAYLDYLTDATLRRHSQVIAVDRPGFGYSDYGVAELSLKRQAEVFLPILEQYREQRVILVGHSFGGPVIARMAMDFPDLVDGLVMVAGSVCPELEPKEWWRPVLNVPFIRMLLPGSLRVANQEITPLWKELEEMEANWNKISCPVTVIQGEEDKLVPAGNADYAEEMLTQSSKVDVQMIKGGNHFILWSMQDFVVNKIVELIQQS